MTPSTRSAAANPDMSSANQWRSTRTSPSTNATTSPRAAASPAFRARDVPRVRSATYRTEAPRAFRSSTTSCAPLRAGALSTTMISKSGYCWAKSPSTHANRRSGRSIVGTTTVAGTAASSAARRSARHGGSDTGAIPEGDSTDGTGRPSPTRCAAISSARWSWIAEASSEGESVLSGISTSMRPIGSVWSRTSRRALPTNASSAPGTTCACASGKAISTSRARAGTNPFTSLDSGGPCTSAIMPECADSTDRSARR